MKQVLLCEDYFTSAKHTIPREEDEELDLNLEDLVKSFIKNLFRLDWVDSMEESKEKIRIIFRQDYNAENAFSLWGYHVKHAPQSSNS